jgi:hypothetical protein
MFFTLLRSLRPIILSHNLSLPLFSHNSNLDSPSELHRPLGAKPTSARKGIPQGTITLSSAGAVLDLDDTETVTANRWVIQPYSTVQMKIRCVLYSTLLYCALKYTFPLCYILYTVSGLLRIHTPLP